MFVFLPFAFGGNPASESGPRAICSFLQLEPKKYICIEQTSKESAQQYLKKVYDILCPLLKTEKKLIIIGGNHLSILPVYAYFYNYDSTVVTLDAHCDFYPEKGLNHANFMRYLNNKNNTSHYILGARENIQSINMYKHIKAVPINSFCELYNTHRKPVNFLDIDLDVIDPEIFNWCGSPSDNGASIEEVLNVVNQYKKNNGTCLAISEYIPNFDTDNNGFKIIKMIVDAFV